MDDEIFLGNIVWQTLRPSDNVQQRLDSAGKSAESELALQYNEVSE